jgi:phosphate transport system substrate-binding protein
MKTMNKYSSGAIVLVSFAFILLIGFACMGGGHRKQLDETPTRGNIKISVDQSFKLLFDTELYTFQALYPDAHITAAYKPEVDVVNDFLNDSVQTIVSTYKLSKEEEENLRTQLIVVRTAKIAYDALAIIINRSNPDSSLISTDVESIFKGEITQWKEINRKNNSGKIKIVFDNIKSGNIRYFKEKFQLSDTLPSNFMSAQSNNEVISYVEKHKEAMGIISVNWISDKRDTVSEKFLSEIRVCAISPEFDPDGGYYYKPYQAYIADKSYPYVRDVYMECRETFTGLGSGFVQFVAGNQGQLIILKSKLVPATMPVRIVGLK